MSKGEMARFDARLPKEQKEFFEYAANIGGYRSLTDFVLQAVHAQAQKIIAEQEKILMSKRDQEVFFDAILNPPEPNDALKEALKSYREALKQ